MESTRSAKVYVLYLIFSVTYYNSNSVVNGVGIKVHCLPALTGRKECRGTLFPAIDTRERRG